MRELLRWALPGLLLSGPLAALLGDAGPRWPVWLVASPVVGFILQQSVRVWFEHHDGGFRSPRRSALAVIIERGNLSQRTDRGDLAYQVYELVFYQQPEWQAARDHGHRCRDITFLCWSMALAAVLGGIVSLALLFRHPAPGALFLAVLIPTALILRHKGMQTHAAFELFDHALVLAHWPLYEAALQAIRQPAPDLADHHGCPD